MRISTSNICALVVMMVLLSIPSEPWAIDIVFDTGNLNTDEGIMVDAAVALWENHIPQMPGHEVILTINKGNPDTLPRANFIPTLGQTTDQRFYARDDKGSTLAATYDLRYDWDGRPISASVLFDESRDWHRSMALPVPQGKYDFYSVTLHEIAHAVGFASICSRFGRNLTCDSVVDFQCVYNAGRVPTAVTAPGDPDHLDPNEHNNDLMNPNIGYGIRKVPSQLDADLLNHDVWGPMPLPSHTNLGLLILTALLLLSGLYVAYKRRQGAVDVQ